MAYESRRVAQSLLAAGWTTVDIAEHLKVEPRQVRELIGEDLSFLDTPDSYDHRWIGVEPIPFSIVKRQVAGRMPLSEIGDYWGVHHSQIYKHMKLDEEDRCTAT